MYKVRMYPSIEDFDNDESGIKRVIEAYTKYLPKYGFEVVHRDASDFDLTVSHAGTAYGAEVVMIHGLYWTSDYNAETWEWHVNKHVVMSVQYAKTVTVPSAWVQEVFQRDMRFSPHIVPHGIDADDWYHKYKNRGYILWNKNRDKDVCSPEPVGVLAKRFPNKEFVSTFMPTGSYDNIEEIGRIDHTTMKQIIQMAGVYLSTTKETFGIGALEAMAAGVPVLGFAHGGNLDTIQHGVNGYLATPGDYDDLERGLNYCLDNREVLAANGKEIVKDFSWNKSCKIVADIYKSAMQPEEPTVSVVIPAYNKRNKLPEAVFSTLLQERKPDKVVIIDDGSSDDTQVVGEALAGEYDRVEYVQQNNSGVAVARNKGAELSGDMKYLCFLDADDAMKPEFLEACVNALEQDRSIHIAYTRLQWVKPDGSTDVSDWPGKWDYDKQLRRKNQVPTCNVLRRDTFERLGGYKSRYCPTGAGSEDAELWDRFGAYGYKAELVDERPLFTYSFMSGHTAQDGYSEIDWLLYHPWAHDNKHPFASYASPGKLISHPVRQYDQPYISVIIPVGPGHESLVENALDTVDGQSYRAWEAIVVWDMDMGIPPRLKKAYSHVKWIETGGNGATDGRGAGIARNMGADVARGDFLLFLDADDWLYPDALDKMMSAWDRDHNIIYSDYVGKAIIDKKYASELGDRLLHYNESGESVISYRSLDFDCERAKREPTFPNYPYVWNLITSLVPKSWHVEIGGFDESMESWEDWDYWLRMVRSGKCFTRIAEPLVVYRFYTGYRREHGAKIGESLVKYLTDKYEESNMGCNCKDKKTPAQQSISISASRTAATDMVDEEFVLIKYMSPNKGQHTVVGLVTGKKYGHRAGGDMFYVHISDVKRAPNMFAIVERKPSTPKIEKKELKPPDRINIVPNEENLTNDLDGGLILAQVPGVTAAIADQFKALGLDTAESIISMGAGDLSSKVKGVGEIRAEAIIAFLKETQ